MIWIIIGLVLVIAVLGYALFYQIKGNKDQASVSRRHCSVTISDG